MPSAATLQGWGVLLGGIASLLGTVAAFMQRWRLRWPIYRVERRRVQRRQAVRGTTDRRRSVRRRG